MELSWSTFLLEIINFLVLVWILKRFFYKPLQSVIARRQESIEESLATAEQTRAEAASLQRQYEQRLSQWAIESEQMREDLEAEMRTERTKRQAELEESLQQRRQQAEVADERQRRELQRQLEQAALRQGGQFAARLLQQGAGPELEQRLLELLLRSLDELPDEQRAPLREQLAERGELAEVTSAFPLEEDQRRDIEEVLGEVLQPGIRCHFVEDPKLLAGLRITVGPWQLGASVRDELQAFTELPQAGS
ncbi:F0F1 ATP synthase subunit delta [Microbulbifer zhoushanensis]|uniref:F0F1 ATP synthase subunit delta n=1 Tax=Microbulbifer zhoushanensis TaxID=2904254 RepID=UPI001F009615